MFREVGPQVEDGEEDVDLLLLGEEVGGGLAGPHLVRGEGEVSDVVLRLRRSQRIVMGTRV